MKIFNVKRYSQAKTWEQGQSPLGRVALIPTSVYITNKFYRSIETLYANIFGFSFMLKVVQAVPLFWRKDKR